MVVDIIDEGNLGRNDGRSDGGSQFSSGFSSTGIIMIMIQFIAKWFVWCYLGLEGTVDGLGEGEREVGFLDGEKVGVDDGFTVG